MQSLTKLVLFQKAYPPAVGNAQYRGASSKQLNTKSVLI
jgi:hypothetical protein